MYVIVKHRVISVVPYRLVYDLFKRTFKIDTHQFPSAHIPSRSITNIIHTFPIYFYLLKDHIGDPDEI